MTGVDKIKSHILKDADKEISAIMSEAQTEAKKLNDASNLVISAKKKKIIDKGKKDADLEKNRILSSTRLQIHKLNLETKENLVQKSFDRAVVSLGELRSKSKDRYEKALTLLARDGIAELQATDIELCFNQKDSVFGKKIASDLKVKLGKEVEIQGGVIIRTKDKSLQVNNSFEEIMKRQENLLRNESAKVLFRGSK